MSKQSIMRDAVSRFAVSNPGSICVVNIPASEQEQAEELGNGSVIQYIHLPTHVDEKPDGRPECRFIQEVSNVTPDVYEKIMRVVMETKAHGAELETSRREMLKDWFVDNAIGALVLDMCVVTW